VSTRAFVQGATITFAKKNSPTPGKLNVVMQASPMQVVELLAVRYAPRSSMKAKQIIIASALNKPKKRVVSHITTMTS